MIKKFEEFEWMKAAPWGLYIAGSYGISYLIGLIKDYSISRLWQNHVSEMLKDGKMFRLDEWEISEDGDIVSVKRSKISGSIQIFLNKVRRTVWISNPIDKYDKDKSGGIKMRKREFSRILDSLLWLKEIAENIDDCFSEISDMGFRVKKLLNIVNNGVAILLYPESGTHIPIYHLVLSDIPGRHNCYARVLNTTEIESINNAVKRLESMFECISKLEFKEIDDSTYYQYVDDGFPDRPKSGKYIYEVSIIITKRG